MVFYHIIENSYGGVGQYASRLSNGLKNLGYDSRLLCAENEVRSDAARVNSNTLVHSTIDRFWRSVQNRVTLAPFSSIYRARKNSLPSIEEDKVVFHFHGISSFVSPNLNSSISPDKELYFWTLHDLWPISGGCFVYDNCDGYQTGCEKCPILRRPFNNWTRFELKSKRQLIKNLNIKLIGNSKWMASRIEEAIFAEEKVPIVPPIVDDIFFDQAHISLRSELGLCEDRFVVGLSSRSVTDEYKGIPEFIQALPKEKTLGKDVTVLIVGEGELPVPENVDVRILGRIDDKARMAAFYSTLNVFASPSKMETFGMAVAEAQATGTCVVAFDVGGVKEALHPDKGKLIEDGDFESMLLSIKDMMSKSISLNCGNSELRKWIKSRFSSLVVAKKQVELYKLYGTN